MSQPSRPAPGGRPRLPRSVWLVSWTSFFTDTASETVYPLMPVYLTGVLGGTALSLGIIEGAAEALSSLLKIVSGRLADRWNTRKPLVVAGYTVSSLARPLVALASSWPHVLLVRLADRVGKGVRSAPRDALIASWVDPSIRGYAFGLNRSMDHAGAVVGPLLATLFLWFYPGQYRRLFALTIVPGLIAVAMLLPVPDTPTPSASAGSPGSSRPEQSRRADQETGLVPPLGAPLSRFFGVLALFALGNSTDAFLLLRLNDAGVAVTWLPMLWAAFHVVKAVVSPIAGHWSDRVNRKAIITAGWVTYAAVYAAFAWVSSLQGLVAVFLVYGLYYALTEGVEKAVVADLAPADARGYAFGVYNAVIGIGALCASLLFGAIWKLAGAPAAFVTGAVVALASAMWLAAIPLPGRHAA